MMNQSMNRATKHATNRVKRSQLNFRSIHLSSSVRLPRFNWIGLLASVGMAGGILGGWVPSPELTPVSVTVSSSVAFAQGAPAPVSAEDVSNFVRSALAMEPIRKQAVQEIQAVMSQVPAIRCDSQDSFQALDPRVRGVAIKYCNASKRIVETNGLTVARFNEILMTQRNDAKLRERIKAQTCRISPEVCQGN